MIHLAIPVSTPLGRFTIYIARTPGMAPGDAIADARSALAAEFGPRCCRVATIEVATLRPADAFPLAKCNWAFLSRCR